MFNGIYAAQNKQSFLFLGKEWKQQGTRLSHAILRGAINEYGKNIPNYYYDNLMDTIDRYERWAWKILYHRRTPIMTTLVSSTWIRFGIVRQTLINRDWNEKSSSTFVVL